MKTLAANCTNNRFVTRLIAMVSLAALFLLLCFGNASAQVATNTSDPCLLTGKSSTPFFINSAGFVQVITGVPNKRIFVCSMVFSGSASSGFNINFAGFASACTSGFTLLGSLRPGNDVVVAAGDGSGTQFTVPANSNFCIELGGATPLESSGWVTYVQQ